MTPDTLRGLSESQAARQFERFGPNELPRDGGRGFLQIVVETMREPMFLLLLGAAGLYLVLGDLGEGLFLVGGAAAAIGLVIMQETRSERALAALRDLAQPHVRVVRDGDERQILARELVPDDILLVGEGERLAADALLVGGDILSVDESALTGESAPVSKRQAKGDEGFGEGTAPGEEAGPYLFAGTLVVRGQAVARVSRTGPHTALGRIGASLAGIQHEQTPLQKTANRLVGLLGGLALAFCALVAVAYGLMRDDWIGGALAGITVAISLVPEEFPMVLAIFLALGAWRLATHKVLVRRSAVIEALGGATVLCVDKTGTLTENRMQVARLWTETDDAAIDNGDAPAGAAADLLAIAGLASAVQPVDPMDKAIRSLMQRASAPAGQAAVEPERSWPLRPELMAVVQLWRDDEGRWLAAAKGAPEAIFGLCRLGEHRIERLKAVVDGFAQEGLRVLGVASRRTEEPFPDEPQDADFRFEGLVGFIDPLRSDVTKALKEAYGAGIDVVMITGDHPATALAIAEAAGIDTSGGVMLGAEVAALSPAERAERLRQVRIFARIVPEQKLAIVQALKADGEVVVMTGDGVNDAPALEAAHIGVAMGQRGTDVAREAADLVLLDDSFASIVGGVRLGRRIFANLRKALTYIVAIHVPIAGVALAPILMGLPPLLMPMHVVLLELVIDPTCALVFEGEPSEEGAMKRPPRRPDEALFGPRQLLFALLQGGGVFAAVLGVYVWALTGQPEPEARAMAFVALVTGNLTLALADTLSVRGHILDARRKAFWIIAAAATAVMTVVLVVPRASDLFHMSPPEPALLAAAVAIGLGSAAWLAVLQRVKARFDRGGSAKVAA